MDFYQQFPQSNLNFDDAFEDLLALLTKHQITTLQILTTPPFELAQLHNLNHLQLVSFIKQLKLEQQAINVPIQPFNQEGVNTVNYDRPLVFSTGDPGIDKKLGGGIKTGELTEVFGESATGKSQFVMQLATSVSKPVEQGGLEAQCVFISTEGMVETKRLTEMSDSTNLDDIFVINCNDLETQQHVINYQLPTLLSKTPQIKLIIIDSISHHIRVELGYKFNDLKNYLDDLGSRLSQLSFQYNIAVVLTNQISDKPIKPILNSDFRKINYDYQIGWLNGWDEQSILERQQGLEVNGNGGNGNGRSNKGVSTLGLNWDKFINLKILLLKKYKYNEQFHRLEELKRSLVDNNEQKDKDKSGDKDMDIDDGEKFWQVSRWLKVIYSSRCGCDEVEFKIEKKGLIT